MCTVNKHDRSPLNWLLGSLIKHPLFSKKKLNLKKNAMSGSKVFSDLYGTVILPRFFMKINTFLFGRV